MITLMLHMYSSFVQGYEAQIPKSCNNNCEQILIKLNIVSCIENILARLRRRLNITVLLKRMIEKTNLC